MRASLGARSPGGTCQVLSLPTSPCAWQSSVKTSEGGRTGAVELPDIMSLREPSSAVDFISDLQDKLLVKILLYLVRGPKKKIEREKISLSLSSVLPRSIRVT